MGTYRALIVACDFYTDDFAPIPNAVAEAKAFGKALAIFGYQPFEVQYYLDTLTSNVVEAVGKFFTSALPDDFILFYFGGHGRKGDDGALYLALRDTTTRGIVYTSLQTIILNQLIRDCPAKKKVVVLDACYSAAIEQGSRADYQQIEIERYLQQGKGTAILTSSNTVQLSYSREDRRSFTYHLTEGLRNGNADKNGDGLISLDEWFDYAYDGVLSWQNGQQIQNPQMFYKSKEGSIYIGRATAEELEDYPATNLPHSSVPPLKCGIELITKGDVPHLSLILANSNPLELISIEIIGLTGMSSRILHTIERMSPGERVEFTTPLFTDTGPLLQLAIKANDVYSRPFLPAVIQISHLPRDNDQKTVNHRTSTIYEKSVGRSQDEISSDDFNNDEEPVLKKKPKKTFR